MALKRLIRYVPTRRTAARLKMASQEDAPGQVLEVINSMRTKVDAMQNEVSSMTDKYCTLP